MSAKLAEEVVKMKNRHQERAASTVSVNRPWNKAQANFIGVMRLRVSVATPRGSSVMPTPIASFAIGTTWELNREKIQNFALHVDAEAIQTFMSDAVTSKDARLRHGGIMTTTGCSATTQRD